MNNQKSDRHPPEPAPYTRGPWIVTPDDSGAGVYYVRRPEGLPTQQQDGPNARLIAEGTEMIELLEKLTFITETVAHLRGLEREILPTTDKARELIARVKG